jgi:hypothetical protein
LRDITLHYCPNKSYDKLTLNSSFVQEVAQLKVAVAGCEILGEPLQQMIAKLDEDHNCIIAHLIPIAHQVVDGDEALVDHHPAGVESPLYQEVG